MRPDVMRWFERRTYDASAFNVADLIRRKGAQTVSVVIPALNEAATIGPIVRAVRTLGPLVDEIVVMDPGSTDDTAAIAASAGAAVVTEVDVLPAYGRVRGKGDALWKSLHVTSGDLIAFVDADIVGFDAEFVVGLLGPLLTEQTVDYVKATYDRPLRVGGILEATGGGRVTELVARPLLNMHWPALAGVVQPLSGEYAGRRDLLERIPFVSGYGVELGMLIDVLGAVGLDAMAQVDLGRRVHRNQSDAALGRMAAAIWQTGLSRLFDEHRLVVSETPTATLTQFTRDAAGAIVATTSDVSVIERPPMRTIPEYAAQRAAAS